MAAVTLVRFRPALTLIISPGRRTCGNREVVRKCGARDRVTTIMVKGVSAEPRLTHLDVACVSPFSSPADPAMSVPPD
jgi:hypothetical protein